MAERDLIAISSGKLIGHKNKINKNNNKYSKNYNIIQRYCIMLFTMSSLPPKITILAKRM